MFTVDCFTVMTWNVRQSIAWSDNKEHEPAYLTQIPIVLLAHVAMTTLPSAKGSWKHDDRGELT
jgi:hypothetical protein